MTLKMNYDQANALYNLFTKVVLPDEPETMEEKLIAAVLVKVFKKLRNKLEAVKPNGYSLNLTVEEALAYHCYFFNRHLPVGWGYETNILIGHINEIDKQHG